MNGRAALRSYSQNDTRAKTENENPEKLILLLLEKGCLLIRQAVNSLENEMYFNIRRMQSYQLK